MPQINLNKIKEFTSEDVVNNCVAKNMLRTNDYKSWKCKEWQSISYIIFELSKPTLINNIEIGNECSAFVEVLVSNSNAVKQRYQVLLSTSSFMTPSESNSKTNCNRVRVFPREKLSPNAVNEKWDLIKIVCTQPFNKTISYGLSFIRLNSPSNDNEEELEPSSTSLNIGPFKLSASHEEQESESSKTSGSLFAKRFNNQSSDSLKRSPLASAVGITPQKTRDSSQTSSNNTSSSVRPKQSTSKTTQSVSPPLNSSSNTSIPQRADPSPPKKQRIAKTVPFNELMSKVVFALSGFVNPKRSQLRDKASEMGAKYRADWNSNCTHLVCAFANTPKFNEVKAKSGRIVKEKWIEDCYARKSLLPWRSYMLGKYNGPDSAEESEEEEEETVNSNRVQYIDEDEEDSPQSQSQISNQLINSSQNREIIGFGINSNDNHSENDMNDEIYDAETDSESNADTNSQNIANSGELKQKDSDAIPSTIVLDIFKEKYFHFYGPFDDHEKQILTQVITSFKGKLEDNLTSNVKFVITNSDWNDDFEEACAMNESLIFVKPKWIYKCRQNSKLVAYQPFVVSCNFD